MKKKLTILWSMALLLCLLTAGCGTRDAGNASDIHDTETRAVLEDGIYQVDFDTDSGMFHVNEACEGKGILTVKDGEMVVHISMPSKNIEYLFLGLAEDAEKEGAVLIQPTEDSVIYSDGMTETVHGFDVPVPVLDEEFDLALLGTKGKWYDHRVSVSNPEAAKETDEPENTSPVILEDGEYTIDVTLEGGSGRAVISSPAALTVREGQALARIEWSSPNYDYMKVGEEIYYPVNTEGNSVFEIPVDVFDEAVEVIADTTAMSTPHEVAYTLTFDSDSLKP